MVEIEILRFRFRDKNLKKQAQAIRTAVFVEEQGVPADLEYDEYDETAQHYLLFKQGKAVATARWRISGQEVKLERFATLKESRNGGVGRAILEAVMMDVLPENKPIYLHAQEGAVRFYHSYGFRSEGEPFMEAGIRHCKMYWPLD